MSCSASSATCSRRGWRSPSPRCGACSSPAAGRLRHLAAQTLHRAGCSSSSAATCHRRPQSRTAGAVGIPALIAERLAGSFDTPFHERGTMRIPALEHRPLPALHGRRGRPVAEARREPGRRPQRLAAIRANSRRWSRRTTGELGAPGLPLRARWRADRTRGFCSRSRLATPRRASLASAVRRARSLHVMPGLPSREVLDEDDRCRDPRHRRPGDPRRIQRCSTPAIETIVKLGQLAALVAGLGTESRTPRHTGPRIVRFFTTTARQHHLDEGAARLSGTAFTRGSDEVVRAVRRLRQDHGWLEEDWLELRAPAALASGQSWSIRAVLREGRRDLVAAVARPRDARRVVSIRRRGRCCASPRPARHGATRWRRDGAPTAAGA